MGRSVQVDGDRSPRIASVMTWLSVRPRFSLTVAVLALPAILGLDLVVPGYAVAGAYLVLVIFAAVALPQRTAIVIAAMGLALTLAALAVQDRMDTENLVLVWFGVLAGAGLVALVGLYNSVEALFKAQAVTLAREAFLVDLVDALLPLDDPREAEQTVTRLLSERLRAGRVTIYEADETGRLVARREFARQESPLGPLDIQAFAVQLESARDGRALRLPAPGGALTEDQQTALDEAGLRSCLASTLHEEGRLAGAIVVCDAPPREWTADESELLAESAARAWPEVRRARSDLALRQTESRLRDTLDSSVDGLYRLNMRTGRLDYMSPSLAAMTGVTMEELSELDGPLGFSSIHPDDQAEAAASLARLKTEGVAEVECRWCLSGEYRWYSGVIRLTSDEDGEPLFQTGTFRDVTEHKRREQNVVFVSELQDELAQLTSADDVMRVTGALLGAHLGVTYVYLTEMDPAHEDAMLCVAWTDEQTPPLPSRASLSVHVTEDVIAALREGRTVVCADTDSDPRTATEAYRTIGVRSWAKVPLRREGGLAFTFCVAHTEARDWRDDEVELLRDVAVRVFPRLERARAEEAQRALEERFRLIVTTATEGIALADAAGRITFVNETLAGWLGYAPDEMLGRTTDEFLAEEDPAEQAERMRQRQAGISGHYDTRLKHRTGALKWVLVSGSPVMGEAGEFAGHLAMFTDIGERKETEGALTLQAHLLANVHDAICATDSESRVVFWNEAAEQLFGWTREEAMGQPVRGLLQTLIPESSREHAVQEAVGMGSFEGEVRYRHKDGHGVWADVHSRVITTKDGAVEGLVASFRDIAEQKHAQEALTWEAARLRAIVEAAPVGLGVVGANGEVLLRNDVLRRIWAGEKTVHSVDEFESYAAFWPETGKRLLPEDWPAAQALKNGRSFADVVVDIERFDGTRGTIVLSTAPILDNGAVLGAVTIVQDITRMREAEQALRFLTDQVRSLHEAVVMDQSLSSVELATSVVAQAGLLLGSDGTSIFLLGEGGSLRRVAGVGAPDAEGIDDLVAEAIGERATAIRPLPPPAWEAAESRGSVMLAVPLVIRGEVFGAMAFTYEDRRSLSDSELRIARAFADQAALAIENARLRARIEEAAIEAERTRLARDLHDSVTQSLFAASLKGEALAELLGDQEGAPLEAVEEIRRLTRGALAGMRTMLLEMRADGVAQTPLPELLRHLVEASGSRIGADIRLTVQGQSVLPADVQTALYRIAQEALNNVARHAKAVKAWVDLRLGETSARLEIGDDGIGFQGEGGAGHFGLHTMRERADNVSARFQMVTGAGRGTVVTVEWPWAEGAREGDDV